MRNCNTSLKRLQAAIDVALKALEEAPIEVLKLLEAQSDAFLVPRVGNSKNFLWPAVQLNLARAMLYGSRTCFQSLTVRLYSYSDYR